MDSLWKVLKIAEAVFLAGLLGAIVGRLFFRYGNGSQVLVLCAAFAIVIVVSRLTGWPARQ